jgi:hypothetical protein
MRLTRLCAIVALLVSSCTSEVDSGPQRPEPSEPSTGAIVREVTVGDTDFLLHDEEAGCVAAEIVHPGLQSTVERRCFGGEQVLSSTRSCGWLDARDERAQQFDCDVELPVVFFGRVTAPGIGYVCVGTIEDTADGGAGVVAARFVDVSGGGFILEPAGVGESDAAHLFTVGGLRYGEPPLDAPSDPIYRLCEAEAPWGRTEIGSEIEVWITLDEALQTDDLVFGVAGGTGSQAVAGGAFSDGAGPQPIYLVVPSQGSELTAWVETVVEGDRLLERSYPWPAQFLDVLSGEVECEVARISVHFAERVRSGDADAVSVSWEGRGCPER